MAPNGLSVYNHFTGNESVNRDYEKNAGYGVIPKQFGYLKF